MENPISTSLIETLSWAKVHAYKISQLSGYDIEIFEKRPQEIISKTLDALQNSKEHQNSDLIEKLEFAIQHALVFRSNIKTAIDNVKYQELIAKGGLYTAERSEQYATTQYGVVEAAFMHEHATEFKLRF